MQTLKIVDRICYAVCIVCIVAGVALGIAMIWIPNSTESLGRALATVAVVFLGSSLALAVNKTYERRRG